MDSQSQDCSNFKTPMAPKKKVAIVRPSVKINEELLIEAFGTSLLHNTSFEDRKPQANGALELKNFHFRYLKTNFILKVNKGFETNCFQSSNGAIALFDVNDETIEVLNHLLFFLLKKFPVDPAFTPLPMDKSTTLFIRPDRLSLFYNSDNMKIDSLPQVGFYGNVALKVIGLQFYIGADNMKTVKLLVHISQIRVNGQGQYGEGNNDECMFD